MVVVKNRRRKPRNDRVEKFWLAFHTVPHAFPRQNMFLQMNMLSLAGQTCHDFRKETLNASQPLLTFPWDASDKRKRYKTRSKR